MTAPVAALDLFRIRFAAALPARDAARLAAASGMIIGGVDDEDEAKEMPGSGFFGPDGGRVALTLTRLGPRRWELEAFTHHPDGYDADAVRACHQRILTLLPEIASRWEELPVR